MEFVFRWVTHMRDEQRETTRIVSENDVTPLSHSTVLWILVASYRSSADRPCAKSRLSPRKYPNRFTKGVALVLESEARLKRTISSFIALHVPCLNMSTDEKYGDLVY